MSSQVQTPIKRITVPEIRARKGGEPIVVLTAYDAPTAALMDAHCDVLLVGDSVGMAVHGLTSTVGVTLEMMILHGQAVMRGAKRALVVIDMPFGSYEAGVETAYANAVRVMKETGAQAIKVESGPAAPATIDYLVKRGIPVMGHVGLLPQSINIDGTFKAKGREEGERARILQSARDTADAGAFAVVIEGVAEGLAREITEAIDKPTIGIGASAACDGQVLVSSDMLGLFDWTPKFVRKYADLRGVIDQAVATYADDVRARRFPAEVETYFSKKPVST
ncbi:3-methyl-2-oxobutanoate hydroxymethyltransferase [Brevundimonas sp.]|uniref:3-methyl-2-oxobutanoate hydroxymethyltransferase n=1 Tax=Brevundimonas sp. TaxID=1871086 RepID=UPI00356A6614